VRIEGGASVAMAGTHQGREVVDRDDSHDRALTATVDVDGRLREGRVDRVDRQRVVGVGRAVEIATGWSALVMKTRREGEGLGSATHSHETSTRHASLRSFPADLMKSSVRKEGIFSVR